VGAARRVGSASPRGDATARAGSANAVSGCTATLHEVSSGDQGEFPNDFTAASDLVALAKREAAGIIDDAERRADLLLVKAERAAAAKQSEAEIYLQKARAVLEIAQQRASNRPRVLSLVEPVAAVPDRHIDLTGPVAASDPGRSDTGPGGGIPEGFDRLLTAAVSTAVANSVASTRRRMR